MCRDGLPNDNIVLAHDVDNFALNVCGTLFSSANRGVKSMTVVHEMVMMLFFLPSLVVTRTTGPDSINVKALLSFN